MQEPGVAISRASTAHTRLESRAERRADALVHVVGVTLGIAACVALAIVASTNADFAVLVSLAVYAAGLMFMLGCSAVYNIAVHDPRRAFWRRLDHAAIFVMIAGTYTPFAAIAIGGALGTGLLVFTWTVAAAGVLLKLLHPARLEMLSICAYLLLGWTILPAIDRLFAAVSVLAFVLLAAGGLLYTAGVVFYRWNGLPYNRAIWHGFVLAGATCQYLAVLDVIIS